MSKPIREKQGFSTPTLTLMLLVLIVLGFVSYMVYHMEHLSTAGSRASAPNAAVDSGRASSTNSPSSKISLSKTPLLSSGTYDDDSTASDLRYILTINDGLNGAINGTMTFQDQDGRQAQTFSYSADASSSPITFRTTPAMSSKVSATISQSTITFANCQNYLQFIQDSVTCSFEK